MKLIRKHFQITEEQLKKIKEEIKSRKERVPKWSESDIVREALDEYLKSKEERK